MVPTVFMENKFDIIIIIIPNNEFILELMIYKLPVKAQIKIMNKQKINFKFLIFLLNFI